MANLNKVILAGRLTRDPEVRYTPSRMAVADLGLAVNRRFKSASGELKEETCFVNITAWGKQAELAEQYLKKGANVFVEGRLKLDEWEKDGKKFSKLNVVAESIQFLDKKGEQSGKQGGDESGSEEEPAASRPRSSSKKSVNEDSEGEAPSGGGKGDDDDLPF